jgi:ribosome-binding factor A
MTRTRPDQVSDRLLRELSQLLLFEANDPDLKNVTLTSVRMTADLREAKVYFDVGVQAASPQEVSEAFKRSQGYLRRSVAKKLNLKFAPILYFFYDETRELVTKANELLSNAERKSKL